MSNDVTYYGHYDLPPLPDGFNYNDETYKLPPDRFVYINRRGGRCVAQLAPRNNKWYGAPYLTDMPESMGNALPEKEFNSLCYEIELTEEAIVGLIARRVLEL